MKNRIKNRNIYIDFARIIFTFFIVYYHIFRSSLFVDVESNALFNYLHEDSKYASICVEFFFVCGGLFLYLHCKKNDNILVSILNRIVRLWPVLFISATLEYVLGLLKFTRFLTKITFLQCIGLTKQFTGISWYVSSFFWASLFFIFINNFEKNNVKKIFIISLVAYLGYVLNINVANGFGRGVSLSFVDMSLFRALAGMGTGHILGYIYDYVRLNKLFNHGRIVFSVMTISSFVYLCVFFMKGSLISFFEPIVVIIMISIFILSSLYLFDELYINILDRITSFSKYTYAIYLMQQPSFIITKKLLARFLPYQDNLLIVHVTIYFVMSILIGVITYYLIEKPLVDKGKRLIEKLL